MALSCRRRWCQRISKFEHQGDVNGNVHGIKVVDKENDKLLHGVRNCSLFRIKGGDIFGFSGTTTCAGDQVDQHSNDPMCLPTSCTSNETDIAIMISMIIAEEGGHRVLHVRRPR